MDSSRSKTLECSKEFNQLNFQPILIDSDLGHGKVRKDKAYNITRDVKALECSDYFRASNFGLSSYLSDQNKELPEYNITRDGFTFLAMGYTGKKAAEFKEN